MAENFIPGIIKLFIDKIRTMGDSNNNEVMAEPIRGLSLMTRYSIVSISSNLTSSNENEDDIWKLNDLRVNFCLFILLKIIRINIFFTGPI